MSIGFNIRHISVTSPNSLYEIIEQDFKYEEFDGATRGDIDPETHETLFYYMAGLTSTSILNSGLSEEDTALFKSALDSGLVEYAIFPKDKGNGYIPVYLNEKSRSYIESVIPALTEKGSHIKWNIFKVNANVDEDNNQLDGAELVVNTSQDKNTGATINTPLLVEYDEIKDTLFELAGVKQETNVTGLDATIANENIKEDEAQKEIQEKANTHNPDDDSMDIDYDADKFKPNAYSEEDEASNEEDTFDPNKYGEIKADAYWDNLTLNDGQVVDAVGEIIDYETLSNENDLAEVNPDALDEVILEEEITPETEVDLADIVDYHKEDSLLHLSSLMEKEEVKDGMISQETYDLSNDFELDDSWDIDTSQEDVEKRDIVFEKVEDDPDVLRAQEFLKMPDALSDAIQNIYINRFKPYENVNLRPELRDKINLFIDQLNENIAQEERNIQDKLIAEYTELMELSQQNIDKALNTVQGDEKVVEFSERIRKQKDALTKAFKEKSDAHLQELKDKFYGEDLKEYKAELMARAKREFEEKYYNDRVLFPHQDFENNERAKVEEEKFELQDEFDKFIMDVESASRTEDQTKATQILTSKIPSYVRSLDYTLAELRRELDAKINEVFRENTALNSDEQRGAEVNRLVTSHFKELMDAKSADEIERLSQDITRLKDELDTREDVSLQEKEELRTDYENKLNALDKAYEDRLQKEITQLPVVESTHGINEESKNKLRKKRIFANFVGAVILTGVASIGTLSAYILGGNDKVNEIQNALDNIPQEETYTLENSGQYEVGDQFKRTINDVDVIYEVTEVNNDYMLVKNMTNGKVEFVPFEK